MLFKYVCVFYKMIKKSLKERNGKMFLMYNANRNKADIGILISEKRLVSI